MKIWTWLKDGKPKGFFKTKQSLLISYDMMPLQGLRRCERALNKEGRITYGNLVTVEKSDLYVPFKGGHPHIDAIDWGCNEELFERCFSSLVFYVDSEKRRLGEKDKILHEYYLRMWSHDKRIRRPLYRLRPYVEQVLFDLGYTIRAVKFKENINP